MAVPSAGKSIEQHLPIVKQQGLNTQKASNLAGFLVDTSGNTTVPGTLTVTGASTINGSVTIATGKTLTVTDTAALTVGGVVVANYEYVTSPTLAAAGFVNGTAY